MATVADIPLDDHLGRSIPKARIETVLALGEAMQELSEDDPRRQHFLVARQAVELVAQNMLEMCALTKDRTERKEFLLQQLQEVFYLSLTTEHMAEVMGGMERFIRTFEQEYEDHRKTFLRDKRYVNEVITHGASNVRMVPIKRRDPQGMFGEAATYLRMAQDAQQALLSHLYFHGPYAGTVQTIPEFIRQDWAETYPNGAQQPPDMAQLQGMRQRVTHWARHAMQPYADVLPADAPLEALGCVLKVDANKRRQQPAVVDMETKNRTDPRVRRELGKVFKTEAYADAGHNLGQLIAAYQLFELLPDPTPPQTDAAAAAVPGRRGRTG